MYHPGVVIVGAAVLRTRLLSRRPADDASTALRGNTVWSEPGGVQPLASTRTEFFVSP